MSNVFANLDRTPPKLPKSPMDVCTIVSIFPRELIEKKETLDPGIFKIPAGTPEKPGILHVGASSSMIDVNPDHPLVEVMTPSTVIAQSVVQDLTGAVIGKSVDAHPGIFFVEGRKTWEDIKKEYSNELKRTNERQKKWFLKLIDMADSLFARSGGNPLAIPEDARLGATVLGISGKAWQANTQAAQLEACPACGTFRNPVFPICINCKTNVPEFLASKVEKK